MWKWHLAVRVGEKYEPPKARKQSASVQCLETGELPDWLRYRGQYPSSDTSQHQMLQRVVWRAYGCQTQDNPILISCSAVQHSRHAHQYRHIHAHWELLASEHSPPRNITVSCKYGSRWCASYPWAWLYIGREWIRRELLWVQHIYIAL